MAGKQKPASQSKGALSATRKSLKEVGDGIRSARRQAQAPRCYYPDLQSKAKHGDISTRIVDQASSSPDRRYA